MASKFNLYFVTFYSANSLISCLIVLVLYNMLYKVLKSMKSWSNFWCYFCSLLFFKIL